jgi:HEAT repeat protein
MRINEKQPFLHLRVEPAYVLRQWARLGFHVIGPKGKEAVPRLLHLLNDADPEVCSTAAICLASVGSADEQAVSILTNRLQTANGKSGYARSEEVAQIVLGLEFFEARAKAAVPLLLPLSKDTDGRIQSAAAWSLVRIDREAATRARVHSALGLTNYWEPAKLGPTTQDLR